MKNQPSQNTASASKAAPAIARWSTWSDSFDDLQNSLEDSDELRMLEEFSDLLLPVDSLLEG